MQKKFGNISHRVFKAQQELELVHKQLLLLPGKAGLINNEKECLHQFVSLSKVEEAFMKQKSRNTCLKLGDHNNFFFIILLCLVSSSGTD
jgi:hypothetical protein